MAKIFFKGLSRILGVVAQLGFVAIYLPCALLGAFIAPKACAKLLGSDEKKMSRWGVFFIIALKGDIYLISMVLPWRWKRVYIATYGLTEYSVKDQVRYYFVEDSSVETLNKMSRTAIREVWSKASEEDIENLLGSERAREVFQNRLSPSEQEEVYIAHRDKRLVELMKDEAFSKAWYSTQEFALMLGLKAVPVLSDEEFGYLLEKGDADTIKTYLEANEPSEVKVKMLVRRGLTNLLKTVARRYGLSSSVIDMMTDEQVAEVKDDLIAFTQCSFVKECRSGERMKEFLSAFPEGKIRPEAQLLMSQEQVRLLCAAGHHLHDDVVHDIIKNRDLSWFKLLIELEGDDFGLSEQEEAMVAADLEKFKVVLAYNAKKEAAE